MSPVVIKRSVTFILLLFLLLPIISFFAVNSFDEKLTDEAQLFFDQKLNAFSSNEQSELNKKLYDLKNLEFKQNDFCSLSNTNTEGSHSPEAWSDLLQKSPNIQQTLKYLKGLPYYSLTATTVPNFGVNMMGFRVFTKIVDTELCFLSHQDQKAYIKSGLSWVKKLLLSQGYSNPLMALHLLQRDTIATLDKMISIKAPLNSQYKEDWEEVKNMIQNLNVEILFQRSLLANYQVIEGSLNEHITSLYFSIEKLYYQYGFTPNKTKNEVVNLFIKNSLEDSKNPPKNYFYNPIGTQLLSMLSIHQMGSRKRLTEAAQALKNFQ